MFSLLYFHIHLAPCLGAVHFSLCPPEGSNGFASAFQMAHNMRPCPLPSHQIMSCLKSLHAFPLLLDNLQTKFLSYPKVSQPFLRLQSFAIPSPSFSALQMYEPSSLPSHFRVFAHDPSFARKPLSYPLYRPHPPALSSRSFPRKTSHKPQRRSELSLQKLTAPWISLSWLRHNWSNYLFK